jgi:tetratricopeptide (TPR) repeat protein
MKARIPRLLPWRRHPTASVLAVLALLAAGGWFGRLAWRHGQATSHWHAAQQALAQRDWAGARQHLAFCLTVWPNSGETHFVAARAARRAGDYAQAREHLRACERLRWDAEAITLEKDLASAQRGDLTEVEARLLERALNGDPDTPLILEALTQGYVRTYQLPGVLYCSEQLLALVPDHVQAHIWHGWVLEQVTRYDDACDEYRQAIALAPDDVWARLSLGELLLFLRSRPDQAAEQFDYLIARQPHNPAYLLGLARCRAAMGRTAEARRLLDEVLNAYPDEPLALSERGRLALKEGDRDRAERLLRRALERSPGDLQAAGALALCLEALGRPAEAAKYRALGRQIEADQKRLEELAKQSTKTRLAPALRAEAGRLCLRLGQEQQGLQWLYGALQEDARQPAAHRALADFYDRKGDFERAAHHRQLAGPDTPSP